MVGFFVCDEVCDEVCAVTKVVFLVYDLWVFVRPSTLSQVFEPFCYREDRHDERPEWAEACREEKQVH